MSNWDYVISHYDIDTGVITNITSNVIGLPMFTDQGSGEVNTSRIELDSPNGEFIILSPLIKQFDRIRITGSDGFTGGLYDHVYDVNKIIPSESSDGGTRVSLILNGTEHHIQKINYSKTHYYEGSAEVIEDIGNNYNTNRKSKQPILTGHLTTDPTNQAPKSSFQNNIYDYGLNEDQGYNRIIETSDKLGSSVDAGGALDFYDVRIDTSDSDFTTLTLSVFPSGQDGDVVLVDTEQVNMGETEGGIDSIKGTLINAWGPNDQGTLPIQHSIFKSKEQRFPLHPTWLNTETYSLNSVIQHLGIHYKSLLNNNVGNTPASTIGVAWQVITKADDYGNVIQYSPWTVDKAPLWKNSGCDLDGTGFGEGCWDGNLVIWDDQEGAFRTWADVREVNPLNINSAFKYGGTSTGWYRGLRILVQGTGAGLLSGTDRNGKSFDNSIAEYDGTEWIVKYEEQDDLLCAVISEGIQYRFTGGLWTDIRIQPNAGDCFHPYDELTNQPGIITTAGFSINTNSAVRVRYDFTTASQLLDNIATFYKVGAWLNFRFPFPINTKNSISEDVGELYGGTIQSSGVPDADKEPSTLDSQNMHLTHDGYRGYTRGLSSEDFGPLSSLEFWSKIDFQTSPTGISGTYTTAQEANFNMRCLIYDTSDNIVFQDFVLRFNNHWEPIKLPLTGFSIYRGRKPLDNPIAVIIPPKELEAQNIFEWRNIKQIVIQTQDSYDSQGRYSPSPALNQAVGKYMNFVIAGGNADQFRRIDLYHDAFRFTKPLLVNTGTPTDRSIEPDFIQRPDIGNYHQLKSDALAELQKNQFQHVEYNITTRGKFDIRFGESFWFRHPRLVPTFIESTDSPDGINTKTVKLVAKKIEYSITDAKDGKGGFLRTIKGVRRFE